MTTVNIEGHLGRVFGSVWNLQVSTFRELFSAMEANSKNLRSYLHQNKKEYWAIFVDGERVESDKFLQSNIKDKKVKIIPILAGAAAALAGFLVAQLGEDADWRKQALEGFKMRGQPDRWRPGKFIHPHDACFDKDGNILVAEWVKTGRISFLRKVS